MRLKTELEYTLNCSPKMLFHRLSTAEGLSEWFADNVKIENGYFTFTWHDWNTQAKLAALKDGKYVRFEWLDHTEENPHYFEFVLDIIELTGDLALIITDCAEHDSHDDAVQLWNSHITDLRRLLGM